jgi:hypothetical protein
VATPLSCGHLPCGGETFQRDKTHKEKKGKCTNIDYLGDSLPIWGDLEGLFYMSLKIKTEQPKKQGDSSLHHIIANPKVRNDISFLIIHFIYTFTL